MAACPDWIQTALTNILRMTYQRLVCSPEVASTADAIANGTNGLWPKVGALDCRINLIDSGEKRVLGAASHHTGLESSVGAFSLSECESNILIRL
jgi:hypothetical protein